MRYSRRQVIPLMLAGGMLAGQGGRVFAQDGTSASIVVGSLSFTEPAILGEMIALVLEDAGYTVVRKPDLGVSADAQKALVDGEIDLYVEYTGGGLVAILGLPVPTVEAGGAGTPVAEQVYDLVAEAYLEQFGLFWLDEFGFNDSYALAVTAETAATLELVTISDLTAHAGELTLGTDLEFPERQDGLPGLEAAYGIAFGEVQPGEPGAMYEAIASGEVDVITAYTTDGRLPGLDLVLLKDDLNFFPPYHAAPVVAGKVLDANPGLGEVINQLAGRIDDETMAGLNAEVDVAGKNLEDVARSFLVGLGILGA